MRGIRIGEASNPGPLRILTVVEVLDAELFGIGSSDDEEITDDMCARVGEVSHLGAEVGVDVTQETAGGATPTRSLHV